MTTAVIRTLGTVLGELTDKIFNGIQQTIESQRLAMISATDNVRDTGLVLQVEAGRQVKLAIDSFKNAYLESLDITIDKLSPEIQKNLATIKQLVDDTFNPQMDKLSDVATRVEQLLLRSPFIRSGPYVYKNTPNFIAHSKTGGEVVVSFFGNFPVEQQLQATFTVGQQTLSPTGDLARLMFKVPYHNFYPASLKDPERVSVVSGELKLSWVKEGLVSNPRVTNLYKIWVAILPSTPGKIVVHYLKPSTQPERKKFTSQEFEQHSGRAGGGKTILNKQYPVSPEAGWEIIRGSSHLVETERRPKNSSYSFVRDDQGQVVYQVTTTHVNERQQSGKIRFRIEFDQCRVAPIDEEIPEEVSLAWGESKVLGKTNTKFHKVVFTAFNGLHQEMAGVNSSNPFVNIRNEGGKLVLCAVDPEKISLLPTVLRAKY